MNPTAKRDYVRSRNKAFRNMMRVTKQQLLHTVKVYGIKGVKKDMTKEQIVKFIIVWKDV